MAATLYLAQQDPEHSRQCLALAQALQPQSLPVTSLPMLPLQPLITPEQYYTQLLERAERGELQAAIQDVEWAVKTSPNDPRSYICRGLLRLRQGDRQAALIDFNQAISLDPQSHVAYCSRGKLRSLMGDAGGAILDFDRALAIEPQDLFIYLARGNVRVGLNDYPGAIADFSQAIAIDPTEPTTYLSRAQTYSKLEELHQAIADYQIAANLYLERQDLPKYQDTLAKLQKLQRSVPKSSAATGKYPPQIAALRQRLLVLVSGHWEIAERLIAHLQARETGYAEQWYLERVIYDLESGL
jgi:tetratricopeptide (TPR) repeat protein